MATQPCPGILQIDVIMSDDGQNIQNTFHVANEGLTLWTLPDIQEVIGQIHVWWADHIKPLLPGTTALVEIKGTDLTSLAGQQAQIPADAGDVGANLSIPLPNNVTAAIKLVVPERGRGVAGRIFWPQMASDQIAEGSFLTAAFEAAAITAMNALLGAIELSVPGAYLCVLSRTLDKVKRAAGIPKVVTNFAFTDNTIDSMKDRLPNHKKRRKPRTP